MIVLSDNDILHKLAVCDLFDEFLGYLQVPAKSICILYTCIFKLRKVLCSEPTALERLERFCSAATVVVEDKIDSDILDAIMGTGADAGEAILAAQVAMTPGAYLITGDKRAIKSLSMLRDSPLKASLAGRILCFEELILGMIHRNSFAVMEPKLTAGCHCDGVLRMAFGPGRSESHAKSCLQSFSSDLRLTASYLLTPAPRAT